MVLLACGLVGPPPLKKKHAVGAGGCRPELVLLWGPVFSLEPGGRAYVFEGLRKATVRILRVRLFWPNLGAKGLDLVSEPARLVRARRFGRFQSRCETGQAEPGHLFFGKQV